MIRQIRNGVFETNSSSTHSLTMCSAEEYERWKKGELLFDNCYDKFVEKTSLTQEELNDLEDGELDDLKSYNEYWEDEDELEGFEDSYTTKTGEKVIAFGMYGYN